MNWVKVITCNVHKYLMIIYDLYEYEIFVRMQHVELE
jgi:hypothetical protein